MNELLTLPEIGPAEIGRVPAGPGEGPRGHDLPTVPNLAEIRERLAAVRRRTRRGLTAPDPVDAAVARLVARHGSRIEDADRLAESLDGRHRGTADATWERLLYDAAGSALVQERVAEAILLLAALAATPGGRADGLLGLAVCGARLNCCEEALVLADEAHRLAPGHPRAHCVAGLCELERGNRKAAQARLAAAARIARRHPEFNEDLRMAQRTLILMQIA